MRAVVASLCASLLVAGCGGDDRPITPGPEAATGRFAASLSGGLGIAVDFTGFDETTRQITAALPPSSEGWSIGIVSIVNRSNNVLRMPVLYATRANGRVARLDRATRMRRSDGEVVAAPDPGRTVPFDRAITVYVLFRGRVSDIRRVEMRVGSEPLVRLKSQKRREPEGSG